jgi:hypothetical protein
MAPGAIFTTHHFLHNLRMAPISKNGTLHLVDRLVREKHSSIIAPFISYKENEML